MSQLHRQTFPTTQAFALSEDQRYTLLHALVVAAEKFDANAQHCRHTTEGTSSAEAGTRLAVQFDRQAEDTRELAARIESAEYVKLGREVTE